MTDDAATEPDRTTRRVKRFYEIASEREWQRLEQPANGALEFTVNKAWISRYLPPPGSRVLDLGGGPGRYSIWLAQQGYAVTLADLSPDLLAVAKREADEAGVKLEAIVDANAMDLSAFADGAFDAALCMGPMYHLLEDDHRQQVAAELFRIVAPGGPVFVAFLNRLQALRVAVDPDLPMFTTYTFDTLKRWHNEGVIDFPIPGVFSLAYSLNPRDVRPLMDGAGFETTELVSSQSAAADLQKSLVSFAERQPELYEWLMQELIEEANDPSILGASFHILYIGRKP